jgi:hypothetical protein
MDMTKNKDFTMTHWQKDCPSGGWNQVTTIMCGRGVGKSMFQQEYINGILNEPMRVLNKKYWPFQIQMTEPDYGEQERWCYANFKSANWRNYGRMFAFKRQEDATLFMLRWG